MPTLVRDTLLVDGVPRHPHGERRIEVVSPATEEVIGWAPEADARDVDLAVAAARSAQERGDWPRTPIAERAALVEAALERLEARAEEIAGLVTAQMGMPAGLSGLFVADALATGRFYAAQARDLPLEELRDGPTPALVRREPVGVVAAIAPWNGPFNMTINKVVPALLAGCAVVFKPAPETPFDSFLVAEAFAGAGLPAGALNVVTGGRQTGAALVSHRHVDKVSFTGSTAAGREIGEVCGRGFKRVQLELGGKSAAIVLQDADLEVTTAALAAGCFINTGQACLAYSRILAPRARYQEVVEAACRAAESYTVGDPLDPATTMGPLVSARQRDRVESYVADGLDSGAKVVTGGGRPAHLPKGWYTEPTVLAEATNDMRMSREEIFGPVTVVIPYDGVDEAVAIANDSDYGLHGAVFTTDDDAALDIAARVRTGTFTVNGFAYNTRAPFGGVKSSGIGRDTGREGLTAFFELKAVNLTPSLAARYR